MAAAAAAQGVGLGPAAPLPRPGSSSQPVFHCNGRSDSAAASTSASFEAQADGTALPRPTLHVPVQPQLRSCATRVNLDRPEQLEAASPKDLEPIDDGSGSGSGSGGHAGAGAGVDAGAAAGGFSPDLLDEDDISDGEAVEEDGTQEAAELEAQRGRVRKREADMMHAHAAAGSRVHWKKKLARIRTITNDDQCAQPEAVHAERHAATCIAATNARRAGMPQQLGQARLGR